MIVDYEPDHLLKLNWQGEQLHSGAKTRGHAEVVATGWCAYTALGARGKPLICAGIIELWPGRAMAWAAFDWAARPVMLEAHRRALAELDRCPYKRVEMYARPGFAEAVKWAKLLRFDLESCMKHGAPDGSDLLVYARFKRSRAVRELLWNSRPYSSELQRQSAQ